MFELQFAEISLGWWYLGRAVALLWPYAVVAMIPILWVIEYIKEHKVFNKKSKLPIG